jgi:hypothetical protein
VTKRDAGAHDGFGVVVADQVDDDVSLLSAEPSTFLSGRTAREVLRRRAGDQDSVSRCEDSALAQRADDPSDVARGEEFL